MIVKLDYSDVKGNTLRVGVEGKKVLAFMRVKVNSETIADALSTYRNAKNIVSFDYAGDLDTLKGVDIGNSIVSVHYALDTVDDTVDDIMSLVPDEVRVIIKLPAEYSNMQVIADYSNKYPNVHFCGGNFLRLEGCRIGCITVDDVPKKVHANKIKLVCKGCACAYETVDINEFDMVEFTNETTVIKEVKAKTDSAKPKTPKKPKAEPKKKVISSILQLARETGVSDF